MTARIMAFMGLALLSISCGTRSLDKGVTAQRAYPSTFSAIRARILLPRCTPCHSLFASHKQLVDGLIKAGDADGSDLYVAIREKRMPPYGKASTLSNEEITAVRNWIQQGALND